MVKCPASWDLHLMHSLGIHVVEHTNIWMSHTHVNLEVSICFEAISTSKIVEVFGNKIFLAGQLTN